MRERKEIKAERKGSRCPGDVCFPLDWKLNDCEHWSSVNAGEKCSLGFEGLSWARLRVPGSYQ